MILTMAATGCHRKDHSENGILSLPIAGVDVRKVYRHLGRAHMSYTSIPQKSAWEGSTLCGGYSTFHTGLLTPGDSGK